MSEMEEGEGSLDKDLVYEMKTQPTVESVKRTTKTVVRPAVSSSTKPKSVSNVVKSAFRKSTIYDGTTMSNSRAVRRNSTGELREKQPDSVTTQISSASSVVGRKTRSSSTSEPLRRSLPESRKSSLPSPVSNAVVRARSSETKKSFPSPVMGSSRTLGSSSYPSKAHSIKTSNVKSSPSLPISKIVPSPSLDSTGRKPNLKLFSHSNESSSVSSVSKYGSLSTPRGKLYNSSDSREAAIPEVRVSRLIMLPKVDIKAGDDVRLDLRGHRIRSLKANGLNLSPSLEFVYLRDNLLSSVEGIDILKRVKVLDLSFNDFKGPVFTPLEACKALQQLYLAGNQITSLITLPSLPNLEFLSIAQNKLRSLSMACQPRLQVLAASKNKVSTLKGFPSLPSLEHIRLEDNPVLEMAHIEAASILLVGPTLKKFNDRDLSPKEIATAKHYPAHTAICITGGWEFCGPKQAVESTFHFLVNQWKNHFPPSFVLMEASVDQPFEEDACSCHFLFIKDKIGNDDSELVLNYQWFIGGTTLSNFTAIPGATTEVYWPKRDDVDMILKVECTPVLGDTKYSPIFAISSPVSPGTGIPKVLKLDVHGELVEGHIIKGYTEVAWCGGTPGKGKASWLRRSWNSSPVVIVGAEDEEHQLTLDDVDSCLVYMYTPVTEEGTKGEPQYAITDYISPAPPSVNNVHIVGDAVDGNIIIGVGEYFGGREGPSKFEWLRKNNDAGDFIMVLTGTNEYTLTKEDVGSQLVFVYVPINIDGLEGKSMSTLSPIVRKAPPKVTDLKIIGDLREGSKVTVTGSITGGTEKCSRVQWFKTFSLILDSENGLEAISTCKLAMDFRIPLGAVGCYIVAKFTPMNAEGESGESVYVKSERAVETLPPSLNFLSITGDYLEGGILTASYGYVGGHEGNSNYNWYLHEVETGPGMLIPEVSGCLQYSVTRAAIGKLISFTCTPVRDDGIMGESRTCMGQERVQPGSPMLLSLQVIGNYVEGCTLYIDKQYWGGEEGDSIVRWFRISPDGMQKEIKDATMSSYLLSADDIGCSLSVSCEPVRRDLVRGPIVFVEQIGPISPGPPTCKSLELHGEMMEGEHLSFVASYTGGEKGDCFFEWFRVKDNGLTFKEKLHSDEHLYLTLEDVGGCVELVYTPVRKDGVRGISRSIMSGPITPAFPVVTKVCVKALSLSTYSGEGEYVGGYEGASIFSWYRKTMEGTTVLIDNANCRIYEVTDPDYNCRLLFGYTPVRSDSVAGELQLSEPTDVILPEIPKIEILALTGKAVEGDVLTAVEVIPKSDAQQNVWKKYIENVAYQWFCLSNSTNETFEPVPSQRSCSYKLRFEDIGCRFKCECIVTDTFGRSSELAYVETAPVSPGIPRIDKLEIEGIGFHTNLYAVRGIYSGGKEGKSKIQWLRSMVGSPDLISISGETGRMYEANVDDVGYRLVVVYIPVREDGVEGQHVSTSTEPIIVEPDVLKEVKQKLDLGNVKFEVLRDKDRSPAMAPGLGSLERRILEVNKKRVKVVKPGSKTSFPATEIRGSYAPPFHVEIFGNDQHRFKIVVDSENEMDLMVQTRHLRDVIVLVIRGFAQRFNSTSLNSLLKIDA